MAPDDTGSDAETGSAAGGPTEVYFCNRTFYCNDNKITEFDMINTKNSSTAYVVIYKLIT